MITAKFIRPILLIILCSSAQVFAFSSTDSWSTDANGLIVNDSYERLKILPLPKGSRNPNDLNFIIFGQTIAPENIGSPMLYPAVASTYFEGTNHLKNKYFQSYCVNNFLEVQGVSPNLIGTYVIYAVGRRWTALSLFTSDECKDTVSITNHTINIKYEVVNKKKNGRVYKFVRVINRSGEYNDVKKSSYFNKDTKTYHFLFFKNE